MATRTIHECDRCKYEIRNKSDLKAVKVGDKTKDLCNICQKKLDRFLNGEELEVPPLC